MTKCKVTVYDRVYLDVPTKRMVIELLDGYDSNGDYQDSWRLIDLNTGEEFARNANLHDVIRQASLMTSKAHADQEVYIVGRPPEADYVVFRDLPMVERMKWVSSHAKNLEHDFRVMGPGLQNGRDPIEVAVQELNEMYNEQPCFYLDRQTGKWELDEDKY
jgi:hypothetical protein